ncbi:Hypothetical predicted protein [Octopus vulgaris]|uniref:Uncharacterized protein n=1 Tax=Octopus vulgaris TaxID=6645 RepID=A0AA36BXM1_OCTVU|nr:Hypothetical predicted protein [Octopus vulgaris]
MYLTQRRLAYRPLHRQHVNCSEVAVCCRQGLWSYSVDDVDDDEEEEKKKKRRRTTTTTTVAAATNKQVGLGVIAVVGVDGCGIVGVGSRCVDESGHGFGGIGVGCSVDGKVGTIRDAVVVNVVVAISAPPYFQLPLCKTEITEVCCGSINGYALINTETTTEGGLGGGGGGESERRRQEEGEQR